MYGEKLQGLIDDAVEELKEWRKDNPGDDPNYHGTLHELADSQVPVYYSDQMAIAEENFNDVMLGTTEIETDGTPMQHIAVRIYEILLDALWEAWREWEEEDEDEEVDV